MQGHRDSVCKAVNMLGSERANRRVNDKKESCLKAINEIIKILNDADLSNHDSLSFNFNQALICIAVNNTPVDVLMNEIASDDRSRSLDIKELIRALTETTREMTEILKELQG